MNSVANRRVLIVGTDGLRPDLLDPNIMPTFSGLVAGGVRVTDYQGVYPTHTRVQMSTLSTGCLPGKHGTVANVYRYEGLNDDSIMNTADYRCFQALDRLTGGRAIRVPSIADLIHQQGGKLALATTASSGSTFIWNRNYPERIVNSESNFGLSALDSLRAPLGELPQSEAPPKLGGVEYVARAVTDIFLDDPDVQVIVMWLAEPDATLHRYGIGSPETETAMRGCDDALSHILEAMDRKGIRDQFDIIYLSDHGHSSVAARRTLAEHLDRARLADQSLPKMVTASDFIYPDPNEPNPTRAEIVRLIEWLQEQPWTGAIFTSAPELARYPGVFSFDTVWGSTITDRAPLLAVSPSWSDTVNEFGVPGTVSALTENVALRTTHGSVSPYELHAIAAFNGESFKSGSASEIPACAIDISPTVLTLLGLDPGPWMDGRVLWEVLDQPNGEPGEVRNIEIEPATPSSNGFRPKLHMHVVGDRQFVHAGQNGHPADI